MTLPAYSEDGYERQAWGDVQPDWTVAAEGYCWFDGDVYRDRCGDNVTETWRCWVVPEKKKRMRFTVKVLSGDGKRRQIEWPTNEQQRERFVASRQSLSNNTAARNTALTKQRGEIVERSARRAGVSHTKLDHQLIDTPIEDLADQAVRMMAAIVADPEADIKLKKDASQIAKDWSQIGERRRTGKALDAMAPVEATGREVTADDRAKLNRLANAMRLKGLEAS